MRQAHTARTCLVVLLLLVLFTGCGTQGQLTSTASPAPTSSVSDTPTASSSTHTSNSSDNLSPNKTGTPPDQLGLHIDASDGVQCPLGAELQQMSDYVSSVGNPTTPVPDTLSWVLGGPTDTSHVISGGGYIYNCGIRLGLTNTSQNSIQISNAGVQLAGDTQQNNYHYRLIDICTIITSCKSGGGPGDCSQYFATIKLGTGPINTVFSAIPAGRDSSCGELTLNPGDEKTLYVYIYSAQNLIYSVVPQLVLTTDSGPNTLTLTDLTSTLAFANGGQFTCYALHGDTFVAETTPPPDSYCL